MDLSATLRCMDLNPRHPSQSPARGMSRHQAEAVGIGPSSMSAALARLRKMFANPLPVRSGRVLELTPMGRALVEPVRTVFISLERLLAVEPHFDPAADSRSFTVVASDYVTLVVLRPLLAACTRRHRTWSSMSAR